MVSLATGGAAFFYNQLVDKQIKDGNRDLAVNENAFDPNTIQELGRLNDRMNAADQLLKKHIAVSNFFPTLGPPTYKTLTFNSFSYKNNGEDKVSISMSGQAKSYETIALQSRSFTDPTLHSIFHSPIFTDLNQDSLGNVSFSFNMLLDPAVISYYKAQHDTASNPAQSAPQTTPARTDQ